MKKRYILPSIISAFLIFAFAIGLSACLPNSNSVTPLGTVEVREYQGEDLSSVNVFRENSIKGPQYIDISDYQLQITGLVENPTNYISLPDGSYTCEIVTGSLAVTETVTINEESPEVIRLAFDKKEMADKKDLKIVKKIEEVVVAGTKRTRDKSRNTISADEARLIPGTGGDLLLAVRNLPGVITTSIIDSSLFIRGGNRADILYVYIDTRIKYD